MKKIFAENVHKTCGRSKLYIKNKFVKNIVDHFELSYFIYYKVIDPFRIRNINEKVWLTCNLYKKLSHAYRQVVKPRVSILALKMIESHFGQEEKIICLIV